MKTVERASASLAHAGQSRRTRPVPASRSIANRNEKEPKNLGVLHMPGARARVLASSRSIRDDTGGWSA
jgi:hypothetical protein